MAERRLQSFDSCRVSTDRYWTCGEKPQHRTVCLICVHTYRYISNCVRAYVAFVSSEFFFVSFFKNSSSLLLSFSFDGSIGSYWLTREEQVDERKRWRRERREEKLRLVFFFFSINYPEQFFFNKNTKPRFSRHWRRESTAVFVNSNE